MPRSIAADGGRPERQKRKDTVFLRHDQSAATLPAVRSRRSCRREADSCNCSRPSTKQSGSNRDQQTHLSLELKPDQPL